MSDREITQATYEKLVKTVKEEIFFGSDANEGVAASAKMNMIIAGDGHTNIRSEDSLSSKAENWNSDNADCDLIITNPPFGTSEGESLTKEDFDQYSVASAKGQYLFLQKMISATVPGGEICTVIDEGLLNTETGTNLRKHILQQCRVKAIINLPSETFKPNKINVRSSVLYLEKRKSPDIDFDDHYCITFCKLDSLGYLGSGDKLRGFDSEQLNREVSTQVMDSALGSPRSGYHWIAYDVDAVAVGNSSSSRLDYKYWDVTVKSRIDDIIAKGNPTIKDLNTIPTARGKSPIADSYVDEDEGFAVVIKAGSNINRFGMLTLVDADWIEKSAYDEYVDKALSEGSNQNLIRDGDVLLASTGDGTLGKACVYDKKQPAVADGHVTIIRVDPKRVYPYYLADYLRNGFGADQVERLYTGSTGLIELTPDQVDSIVVELPESISEQERISKEIRSLERKYEKKIKEAQELLDQAQKIMQ